MQVEPHLEIGLNPGLLAMLLKCIAITITILVAKVIAIAIAIFSLKSIAITILIIFATGLLVIAVTLVLKQKPVSGKHHNIML
jgi:hypothetical protein